MQFFRIESFLSMVLMASNASAFVPGASMNQQSSALSMSMINNDEGSKTPVTSIMPSTRKAFLASIIGTATAATAAATTAWAEEESDFASIAARAASIAKTVQAEEEQKKKSIEEASSDPRTIYDFTLPIKGENVPLMDLVKQEFTNVEIVKAGSAPVVSTEDGAESAEAPKPIVEVKKEAKVKAILVVNIKQDDPIARKNIPELISLAAKFGRTGEFAVICSPSDQGYFEPDTSALIRLKLASEYGYGINPATIITDKVNLLGTGADPFWRYIEGTCRAPSGLGRIQGNFEKFLVDGRTGRAVRRYPRKYQPFDIVDDIDALMKGKPLPPAGSNWKEEWRSSDKDAEKDVYRFQKGLNFFDQ